MGRVLLKPFLVRKNTYVSKILDYMVGKLLRWYIMNSSSVISVIQVTYFCPILSFSFLGREGTRRKSIPSSKAELDCFHKPVHTQTIPFRDIKMFHDIEHVKED